jgi:hypothetical protein
MPNLVGIGNSQVPTNAMLGGLAYQDSVGEIVIDKIKARTVDTATDIFVYDTRKDSDGGAWRKRTQHTSWYNEVPSATRGARKEFPAVAVIVAEENPAYKVTIYDGDDPNLSMWMQWIYVTNDPFLDYSTPGSHHLGNYAPYALSAMNGIVCVGTLRSAGHINNLNAGLREFHFIEDTCFATNNDKRVRFSTSIADRNVVTVDYKQVSPNTPIVNSNVNDVAMTVLPNAPIDASTGLPVPTIAVGTDGGVSVLKDDGTVIDWTETTGPDSAQLVTFRKDGKLGVFTSGTAGIAGYPQLYYIEIPTADASATYWYNFNDLGIEKYGYNLETNSAARLLMNTAAAGALSGVVDTDDNTYASTSDGGLGVILPPESVGTTANMTTAAISYVTKDYNTGYMIGDIRGAFLSDTDDTDVTGTYLYLDNFSNNDKGWGFADNGSDGISGGVMTIANNNSARATDGNALTGVATGTKLLVKFTVTFGAAGTLSLDDDGAGAGVGGNTNLLQATKSGSGTQTFSSIYTKTASNRVRFIRTSGGNFQIDDFEMKILPEDDRSVKNNGLAVYGTVPKQAVATGAELVSYGPFSTSNRLQQPYNSDFDFGTGEFSVMFWFKSTASGSEQFVRKGDPSTDVGCFESYITAVGGAGNVRFVIKHTDGSSNTVLNAATQGWNNGVWHHYVGVRRSGGNMQLYLNGELSSSATSTYNVSNNLSVLDIGSVGSVVNGAASTYLSLVKISASAPSAKQIKKMYDDEKCLFHENAKCTLYGTSNDINALAVDDSNNVVHAGTSSGRSDFRGLNRINNTTTAVTTAISASDGLVAEQ